MSIAQFNIAMAIRRGCPVHLCIDDYYRQVNRRRTLNRRTVQVMIVNGWIAEEGPIGLILTAKGEKELERHI